MNAPADLSIASALHSKEAEQSVLGGLLIDNGAIDRIPELQAQHFGFEAHRRIFAVIASEITAGRPADAFTVHDSLQAQHGDSDLKYLLTLSTGAFTAANIRRYAALVIERSKARSLLEASTLIAELAQTPELPIDSRIEQAQQALEALGRVVAQREPRTMREVMLNLIDSLTAQAEGKTRFFPTGLVDLDERLGGGFWPGEVIIIGARPGMGKTALALTAALHQARTLGVGFLSMEMPDLSIGVRVAAQVGRLSMSDARRPDKAGNEFWSRLTEATEAAAELNFVMDDQGGLTISQVAAKARAMKRKHGLDVLVVDYLQLMTGTDPRQSRTYQLEEIMRGLKALAKALDIAVVVLAQVNRRVEGGMPALADLKDSGAIEQDADVVMFLHRPIQSDPAIGDEFKHFAELRIAKQRQGENGDVPLSYIGQQTRFANWSGPKPVKEGRRRGDFE